MPLEKFPAAEAASLMLATVLPRAAPPDMDAATRFVREMIDERVERLISWSAMRSDDGTLRGLTAVSQGRFEREVWVVADPTQPDHPWLSDALDRIDADTGEHVSAIVDPRHPFVLEELMTRGFGITKIYLDGQVDRGLEVLHEVEPPDVRFEPATANDIEQITASRLAFFRRHQERCYGIDSIGEEVFAQVEASQRAAVSAAVTEQTLWTVRQRADDRRVGSFGLSVHRAHPLFGTIAGVDLNLDDSHVGRGLCRPMYRTMLRRADELGVNRYRGTTWNPAVLHLAEPLGRSVAGWFLRRRGPHLNPPPHLLTRTYDSGDDA